MKVLAAKPVVGLVVDGIVIARLGGDGRARGKGIERRVRYGPSSGTVAAGAGPRQSTSRRRANGDLGY